MGLLNRTEAKPRIQALLDDPPSTWDDGPRTLSTAFNDVRPPETRSRPVRAGPAQLVAGPSTRQSRWLVCVNSTVDSIDVSEGFVRRRPKTRTFAGSTAKTATSSWPPCRNPVSVAS